MTQQKQRLFLLFHGRFPGEKAASVFAAKSAEAFSEVGFDVVVVAPQRFARSLESPKEYYGLKYDVETVYVPILDLFGVPFLTRFAFVVSYATFSICSLIYLLWKAKKDDIIFSNEALPLALSTFFFKRTFFEAHDFLRQSVLNRTLLTRSKGVIATNRWKRQELARQFGVPDTRILYEANAVDLDKFLHVQGNHLREKLRLPAGSVLVGYAGALNTMGVEKGIRTFIEAIAGLPPRYRALIIGGNKNEVAAYQSLSRELHVHDRIMFLGWVRHEEVPAYLSICDVLAAPFPKTEHYEKFMSPMKVFEYMAAGRPIVATKLQSIEEILDDSTAYLVSPGDSSAFAKGIEEATGPDAKRRAEKAHAKVQNHSWLKRAERLKVFLNRS